MAARARRLRLGRRGLLTSAALSGLLLGCGTDTDPRGSRAAAKVRRVRYGEDHPDQFAELRMPDRAPLATVVLLHGGYWRPEYGLDQLDPLAERFTALGFATWNVEYRRTDAGGGVPATLEDAAAAVDRLAGPGLPAGLSRKVVVVGHSAGGHLAAWVASRNATTPGGVPAFPLRGSVSLCGVLDLTRAATRPGSADPVAAFVGGTPDEVPENYAAADPALLVPPSCPVWAVQATEDEVVPAEQATRYVDRATRATRAVRDGGEVTHVPVPGDHVAVIDPGSSAFATIRRIVTMAVA